MLLKSQILDAQSKCRSAAECARYLNVNYKTYKKWAEYHEVFHNLINASGKGIPRLNQRGRLEEVLNGNKPHWNLKVFTEQLVRYGYKKDCCEVCGYDRKRPDGKAPYLLHFLDDNRYNHKLENIQFLCYNCYYVEVGRELIGIKKRKYWTPNYFSKVRDKDYSKYTDFPYDDFDLESVAKEDLEEVKKKDEDVDELFKKFNQ